MLSRENQGKARHGGMYGRVIKEGILCKRGRKDDTDKGTTEKRKND
jgi:hypothetical protein